MTPQPLYVDQFKQLLWAMRSANCQDKAGMRAALTNIAQNALADDGTDRKLDYLSLAFFRGIAHNMMPGIKDGLPLDPFYISRMDERLQRNHPQLHHPSFVELTFNEVLDGTCSDSGLDQTQELILGLLTRTGLSCLMLEDAVEDDETSDFESEYSEFLRIATAVLQDWQDNGQIPADWELPNSC